MLGYVISKKIIEKGLEVASVIREKEIFNPEFRFKTMDDLKSYLKSCGIKVKNGEFIYEGHLFTLDTAFSSFPRMYGIRMIY